MYKNHSQDKYTGVGLLGGELYWPLTSPNQNMNGVHKDKSKVDYLVVAILSAPDFTPHSLANRTRQVRLKSSPALEK